MNRHRGATGRRRSGKKKKKAVKTEACFRRCSAQPKSGEGKIQTGNAPRKGNKICHILKVKPVKVEGRKGENRENETGDANTGRKKGEKAMHCKKCLGQVERDCRIKKKQNRKLELKCPNGTGGPESNTKKTHFPKKTSGGGKELIESERAQNSWTWGEKVWTHTGMGPKKKRKQTTLNLPTKNCDDVEKKNTWRKRVLGV